MPVACCAGGMGEAGGSRVVSVIAVFMESIGARFFDVMLAVFWRRCLECGLVSRGEEVCAPLNYRELVSVAPPTLGCVEMWAAR